MSKPSVCSYQLLYIITANKSITYQQKEKYFYIRKESTTMSKIGYIRVSTEHQETARQQEIMDSYQVDRIFAEKMSGANKDRPQHRVSTQEESPLRSTGRGLVSSMGNGSQRASQAETLCEKWDCRLILFIAVSGNMKRNTESQSRPLLDI